MDSERIAVWKNRLSLVEIQEIRDREWANRPYSRFYGISKGSKGKKARTKRTFGKVYGLPNVSKNDITERLSMLAKKRAWVKTNIGA